MPEFISASSIGPSDTGGALSAEIAYVLKLDKNMPEFLKDGNA
jgi:hypothetical protein